MLAGVIDVGRRLMVAMCIGLLGLVLAIGLGVRSNATSTSCTHPCDGGAPSTAVSGSHSSIPCLRDAACSGGIALGSGAGLAVALVVPAALAGLALAVTRLRRSRSGALARSRLLDGGRFRPPRVLLGI
jgi:hypothetical protein